MINPKSIQTLEDCLVALGVKKPFRKDETLTPQGAAAYNTLRDILAFMQECNVVWGYSEDQLDKLVSDPGY